MQCESVKRGSVVFVSSGLCKCIHQLGSVGGRLGPRTLNPPGSLFGSGKQRPGGPHFLRLNRAPAPATRDGYAVGVPANCKLFSPLFFSSRLFLCNNRSLAFPLSQPTHDAGAAHNVSSCDVVVQDGDDHLNFFSLFFLHRSAFLPPFAVHCPREDAVKLSTLRARSRHGRSTAIMVCSNLFFFSFLL